MTGVIIFTPTDIMPENNNQYGLINVIIVL